MTTPQVKFVKSDGNTGVVRPSATGNLVIIAPSEKGTKNTPVSYTKVANAFADLGGGPLVEFGAYTMNVAGNPVTLIRPNADTAAAYGTVTNTGAGTATPAAAGTAPLDDFSVLITFKVGGALGTTGITYTESLDGGITTGPVRSLGTATSLTVLDSKGNATGVSFTLGSGTQTILAAQTLACVTTGPRMTNANLIESLEALRLSNLPWEAMLIHGESTSTTVSTVDTWLSGREAEGKYRLGIVSARLKSSGETEASYLASLTTAWNSASSVRTSVTADGGDLPSALRGVTQPRPTALGLAARLMASDISRDAAYVADGPIAGFAIADTNGNPKYHDELLFPGLDDIRLSTLRSIDGRQGAYITNPLLISASGSDYVYVQHARVMNRACELAFQVLTSRLSAGVKKNPTTAFILESEALEIEGLVNRVLNANLLTPGRVSAILFSLSRTDDLSSNAGSELTGTLAIQALAYVKKFTVTNKFVRTIAVKAA